MTSAQTPLATYRLQLHRDFRFEDVARIVPYLHKLGISHLYLSPIITSRKGSMHGYDGIDASKVSSERGGEKELKKLIAHMEKHAPHMQIILDIVPNHMATSFDNIMWRDVLIKGNKSKFWHCFDLRLAKSSQQQKIVLPFLGEDLSHVLSKHQIDVSFTVEDGFFFRYFDNRFPLALRSYADLLNDFIELVRDQRLFMSHELTLLEKLVQTMQLALMQRLYESAPLIASISNWFSSSTLRLTSLREFLQNLGSSQIALLLKAQHYQLENWRTGSSHVNYRRFFDINDLVAMRVESDDVFDVLHAKILRLLKAEPRISGLRIDHIDGLLLPRRYLGRLKRYVDNIWIEKIFEPGDNITLDWGICGTTGYEFISRSSQLFIDAQGFDRLRRYHRKINKRWGSLEDCIHESKLEAIEGSLSSDMHYFAKELWLMAKSQKQTQSLDHIETALSFLSASMHKYRTYADEQGLSETDKHVLADAFKRATIDAPRTCHSALDWIKTRLLTPDQINDDMLAWLQKWQQFTGAVAAKGIEDTAYYRYLPLVSLNEVGSRPQLAKSPVFQFHLTNKRVQKSLPFTLNASSTHDTKRSEDTRARINVLSELSETFVEHATNWSKLNRRHQTRLANKLAPGPLMEHLIYQTLLGVWPLEGHVDETFVNRVQEYCLKAAREQKAETSWVKSNDEYETALAAFIARILDKKKSSVFVREMAHFAERLALFGAINSLALLALKIFSPGVPDFYQGCETWNTCLVDPDNRRPVDYAHHMNLLDEIEKRQNDVDELFDWFATDWKSGALKLYLTRAWLQIRRHSGEVLTQGRYIELEASGPKSDHLVAFAREHESKWLVVVVPRFLARVKMRQKLQIGSAFWADTYITLPEGAPRIWTNLIRGQNTLSRRGQLSAEAFMQAIPVVLTGV